MKRIWLFLLCALLPLATGCWDQRELNETGTVLGIAIDKDPNNGQFLCTFEIVVPSNLSRDTTAYGKPYINFSGKGKTIPEAINAISNRYNRKLMTAHSQVLIIDERVASESMETLLDYYSRDRSMRMTTYLYIAKDTPAHTVLEYDNKVEPFPSINLMNLAQNLSCTSESFHQTILDFYQKDHAEGITPVLGILHFNPWDDAPSISDNAGSPSAASSQSSMSSGEAPQYNSSNTETVSGESGNTKNRWTINGEGSALFANNRLIGFLGPTDTQALNLILTKKSVCTNFSVPSLYNKSERIDCSILNSNCSIAPVMENGKIVFCLNLKVDAVINNLESSLDVNDLGVIDDIQNDISNTLKQRLNHSICALQTNYHTDAVGFGEAYYHKYPKQWEKVKSQWDDLFSQSKYTITVSCNVRQTGLKFNREADRF